MECGFLGRFLVQEHSRIYGGDEVHLAIPYGLSRR
ncbi:hypothetical protein Desaf_1905 [Desulfocurvibacter africanus subsp. africanus str. Walvis Bay]|uniref:Uncharacterized protein n=1 Tax=Desulfocurvibacter africanus subsp. africanus str. Walvis Bay TaxID=690850 RepID=F3Z2R7_DESAF|nr:hypothetical protein Desaf_1905 [Desulfocurvibacter africanus subsp. africanus str. Walvis Bay]